MFGCKNSDVGEGSKIKIKNQETKIFSMKNLRSTSDFSSVSIGREWFARNLVTSLAFWRKSLNGNSVRFYG